jgi:cytosine/adenosine deaminase-related metal-dependent hydrolase
MALFERAGVPVPDIWRIATLDAGEALGIPQLGTLEPGAPADLLIFERDPTESLDALATLRAVVAGGRILSRADIDEAVQTQVRHYRSPVVEHIALRTARKTMRRVASNIK